jgi:hypothetical protein
LLSGVLGLSGSAYVFGPADMQLGTALCDIPRSTRSTAQSSSKQLLNYYSLALGSGLTDAQGASNSRILLPPPSVALAEQPAVEEEPQSVIQRLVDSE